MAYLYAFKVNKFRGILTHFACSPSGVVRMVVMDGMITFRAANRREMVSEIVRCVEIAAARHRARLTAELRAYVP